MSLCNSVVLNVELTSLSWLYGLKIHQLRAESTVLLCHALFKTAMIVFYITYTSYYIYMHELFFFNIILHIYKSFWDETNYQQKWRNIHGSKNFRSKSFKKIQWYRFFENHYQTFSIVWKCTYTIIMENQNSSYFD